MCRQMRSGCFSKENDVSRTEQIEPNVSAMLPAQRTRLRTAGVIESRPSD
jgi:hypothetical protein